MAEQLSRQFGLYFEAVDLETVRALSGQGN
jgi:hypothetical protein